MTLQKPTRGEILVINDEAQQAKMFENMHPSAYSLFQGEGLYSPKELVDTSGKLRKRLEQLRVGNISLRAVLLDRKLPDEYGDLDTAEGEK